MSIARALRVPHRLVADTRAAIRDAALEHLEVLHAEHADALTLDLGDVREVDIGGIGILVLVRKRAQELGMTTRLVNAPPPVRRMLDLIRISHLFESDDRAD